ncbi:MAG: pit accessory protein [Verrucomicrobiales bacterium]|nr:pit accessory protein [Verrucomicrobiales bacterium]
MFSLQRLFGKPDKFFSLLEASAEEAKSSIQAVIKIISNPDKNPSLEDFVLARRKEKRIAEEISEELVKTFVTALEREDIEELSRVLYRIPKTAEKFAERFILGSRIAKNIDFSRHVSLLEQAATTIGEMCKGLRGQMNLSRMKEHNDRLQYYEGEADKLILDHYRELYDGSHDAVTIFVLKDLYELLETCVDSCRDAGNVIYHIVLKNS